MYVEPPSGQSLKTSTSASASRLTSASASRLTSASASASASTLGSSGGVSSPVRAPHAATSDAVYVSTGSATDGTPGDSFSMVKLDPVSLSRVAAWTVPAADRTAGDADFGSSPIVFNATVSGVLTQLVGACNKNGYFYAFRTGDFSAPLWRFNVGAATSDGGSACLAGGLGMGDGIERLFRHRVGV